MPSFAPPPDLPGDAACPPGPIFGRAIALTTGPPRGMISFKVRRPAWQSGSRRGTMKSERSNRDVDPGPSRISVIGLALFGLVLGTPAGQDLTKAQITTVPVAANISMLIGEGGNVGVSVGEDW